MVAREMTSLEVELMTSSEVERWLQCSDCGRGSGSDPVGFAPTQTAVAAACDHRSAAAVVVGV